MSKELMVRDLIDKTPWLLGDPGGFQIGKGVWEGDWKDPIVQKQKRNVNKF